MTCLDDITADILLACAALGIPSTKVNLAIAIVRERIALRADGEIDPIADLPASCPHQASRSHHAEYMSM